MSTTEISKFDETKGKEIVAPCPKCSGKTHHIVLSSYDLNGSEDYDGNNFFWYAHYQIIQCQGCKLTSFRQANSNSEAYEQTSETECEYIVYETLYPSRVEGRKGLGDDIRYLPRKVHAIYKETFQAICSESPILAGIGLRALVETICKEMNASGRNLSQKIDGLVTLNALTPNGATILHKIRTLGNNAAHEVEPHNDQQLGLALSIVEHVLAEIYIIPKQVAAQFDA